jgi:hypothetical protein
MSMTTPVALILFNRPDLTELALKAVSRVRPPRLLVVADGPRTSQEAEKCRAARAVIERVDWPCEVLTNFSDVNLGCKERVASGLDWIFSEAAEAIIIEDDSLPDPSFFSFAQQLLERYRDDERIMHINGCNFLADRIRLEDSYYFSRYTFGGYGWASWSRAWKKFDKDMKSWPEFKASGMLEQIFDQPSEQQFWRDVLDRTYAGEIDTWDFQWFYACWTQGGLSIVPRVNLVSNLGFREDATHTLTESGLANVAAETIDALTHPQFIVRYREADALTHQFYFEPKQPAPGVSAAMKVRGYLSAVKGRLSQLRKASST